jgi:hypothetical protein
MSTSPPPLVSMRHRPHTARIGPIPGGDLAYPVSTNSNSFPSNETTLSGHCRPSAVLLHPTVHQVARARRIPSTFPGPGPSWTSQASTTTAKVAGIGEIQECAGPMELRVRLTCGHPTNGRTETPLAGLVRLYAAAVRRIA